MTPNLGASGALETLRLERRSAGSRERDLEELSRSLREPLPRIPSRFFYDDVGSNLFEQICELPEYYPTRTERALLYEIAPEVAARTRAEVLVEIGSGAATKTRLLLDALQAQGTLGLYVPFDVAEATTRRIGAELTAEYPGLAVHGILGDFLTDLAPLPGGGPGGRRLAIFLGGTIGNLNPAEAASFLSQLHAALAPGDTFLLGVDRIKPIARLEAAYNDSAGVTAAFNLNILSAVNRVTGGNFDLEGFRHRAFFDLEHSWIEMRLVATRSQRVDLPALDLSLDFEAGDEILTEISTKYDRPRAEALLATAGFSTVAWFSDPEDLYGLILAAR
ncbi:MAG TPA: L-histidine N(alpha)-methyltransferase [Thermoanaerobaculia bacterium]|jgi:L-histidine N-alpha-methyltransferase|nr:L-histidine N(alpha)-methyltransferase [Thermoanaerobaculia bacterium]